MKGCDAVTPIFVPGKCVRTSRKMRTSSHNDGTPRNAGAAIVSLLVQKFGGTSVADSGKILAAARRAIQAHNRGSRSWSSCQHAGTRPTS